MTLWTITAGIMAAIAGICLLLWIATKFTRNIQSDHLKNTIEIGKIVSAVVIAGYTFYFIDQQRQKLAEEQFQFAVYQSFYRDAATADTKGRLYIIENLGNYRRNFVPERSRLDNVLVSLTETLLKDEGVRVALADPEKASVVSDINADRSPTVKKAIRTLDEVFGPAPRAKIGPDGTLSPADEQNWQHQILTRVDLPFPIPLDPRRPDLSKSTAYFHRKGAARLSRVLAEIKEKELASKITSWGGTYNFRPIRGMSQLSAHAYGAAIDLNSESNALGTAGNMDPRVVEIFKAHGFLWGGDFPGRPQPMHFELSPDVIE